MHDKDSLTLLFRTSLFLSALALTASISSKSETFDPNVLKRGYDQVVKKRYLDSENKNRIGSEVNLSFLGCVEECLTRRRCRSVSYFSRSVYCHLNYGTGTREELVSGREDAVYTNVTTGIWDPGLIGSCKDHNCSLNEVCKRLSLGRRECVLSDCGPVPSLVNNSQYELPDGISIGNRVFYTCNEGYRPTVETRKMFGFCRKNGSWSFPNFQCKLVHCEDPVEIDNANLVEPQIKNYSYGMTVSYTCARNYYMRVLDGGSGGSVHCMASGQWSEPNFECELEVESCDAHVDIDPGKVGEDGVHNITKNGVQKEVYCDMTGGNWTVIQRRNFETDDELFSKTYTEYADGFGSPHSNGNTNGNYWLGNDILAALSALGEYEVMIEIQNDAKETTCINFGKFIVHPKSTGYKLEIDDPRGGNPLNDDFKEDNSTKFRTKDHDINMSRVPNSFYGGKCSGGWWLGGKLCLNCYRSHSSCKYPKIQINFHMQGKSSLMKIRRRN